MTKTYFESYSEHWLRTMIQNNEKKIQEKEKEYQEVEIRYNPLMADRNRREIQKEIDSLKFQNIELTEALNEKLNSADSKHIK